MDMIRFKFRILSPAGNHGAIEAKMLPVDGENELMLLARACQEILEMNLDAETYQITGIERLGNEKLALGVS